MLNEHHGAANAEGKVLDLMIHGICRGWLPAGGANEGWSESTAAPTARRRLGMPAFDYAIAALVALITLAVIASGVIRLAATGKRIAGAVPESIRHVAEAGDEAPEVARSMARIAGTAGGSPENRR
ncbi:MAG: hypothetical protein M3N38_09890 [Pseudomonadota bacterium]|nr:hypothetical protein [Pseudomonadota bacterium]